MTAIKAGQYVTDGTAVFILDDIRDGNRVGDIVFRPVLHDGYIKANGATVTASEYPRLLKFAQDNNLLVNSDVWNSNKAMYVYDANTDTLKVPDAQGRVLQGTTDNMKMIKAGLPELEGYSDMGGYSWKGGTYNGALFTETIIDNTNIQTVTDNESEICSLSIKASLGNPIFGASDTVQPPALALIPQIKY